MPYGDELTPELIISKIRDVVGSENAKLHEPTFSNLEEEFVTKCIRSGYVSSVGSYVDEFESRLQDFTGARNVIAVVNGTSALHLSLLLAGVKEKDEVIVPSLSFVATANAVSYLGATPHFVDCDEKNLGMSSNALKDWLQNISEVSAGECRNKITGKRIKAMVPMHALGHPCYMDELLQIAHDFRIQVVEDAAESLGSFYKDKHTGTLGLLGALSFNGNKIITTGGGGAILTDNDEIAKQARHLSTTAKKDHAWEYFHDAIGFNYRMPNINAALGCAQMENIKKLIEAKRKLYYAYKSSFSNINGLTVLGEPENCTSNFWLQAILLDNKFSYLKDEILKKTNFDGLMTRPLWKLIFKLPSYSNCPRSPTPVAEELEKNVINIPSSAGIQWSI